MKPLERIQALKDAVPPELVGKNKEELLSYARAELKMLKVERGRKHLARHPR